MLPWASRKDFSNPDTYESRGPCTSCCSFCDGSHRYFAGAISKKALIGVLQSRIFANGPVPANCLVGYLNHKKTGGELRKSIWGVINASKVNAGHMHGLVLMLICAQILSLRVCDESKVGTDKIEQKDIYVELTRTAFVGPGGHMCDTLACNNDSCWKGFWLK